MLSASASNNHSLFSFGRNGGPKEIAESTSSYDFLPSVSFDDLQSSLETASTDFKLTQFPSPTGQGSILEAQGLVDKMAEKSNVTTTGGTTRVAIPQSASANLPTSTTRPNRSGSILRRPSTSNRLPSTSSTVSGSSVGLDPPTAPAAMRNRRQSHYPPVSNSNVGKPPRKSIGPGVIDADFGNRSARLRRPSVTSTADRNSVDSRRTSIDSVAPGDTTRSLTNSRASKARSVQPPARTQPLVTTGSTLTPDHSRISALSPRSPRGSVGKGLNPGSANKRISVMPGMPNQSHATGLGARTISPTDTRRAKRMSVHQPQSLNHVATSSVPPPPVDIRASSRSPSMIPRKASATPSSSRTTPDPNRKSYSSGLSVGSSISFNTVRTSTGSIQTRVPPAGQTSRLPAPKALSLHNSASFEEDEDVPPVPAIPKVYESPKESPAELNFLEKKKADLGADNSSIHSNSTGSFSINASREPVKVQRKGSTRRTSHGFGADKKAATQSKKNLQPLRLPPITLGPLSTPTAAKIAALQEQKQPDRNLSPPPSRQILKTPTTPMTASKSSFFSRNRHEDNVELPPLRSSSSIHHNARLESPTKQNAASSSESLMGGGQKQATRKPSISPFLSSSVPKSSAMEANFVRRAKTGADFTTIAETMDETKAPTKPSGPREQTVVKPPPKSPAPLSSPEEPQTPSSITSLRRKLSLSWKRGASKGSLVLPNGIVDKAPEHNQRQESMPPPRIPASLTTSSLGGTSKPPSPTPSTKSTKSTKSTGGYLDTRRRKSSASSLNAMPAHGRTPSDWALDKSKKDVGNDSMTERLTISRNSAVMQKILKPKASANGMKTTDGWTAELDKDDLVAEDEMRKMGARRKETEIAARTLDALRKRATPKERVSPQEAIRIAMLNIYERGEIVDYGDVFFCGTQNACKVVGDLQSSSPNFGYDDDRGDYTIVPGDHLAYRYEIIDVLGKGSFGQVVRCIDHKTGVLVAVKIIRNKKRFHQQALVEVNILQKLREWDPKNKHSMVNFTQSFYFRGHLCISTELLDMNLYEFIKANAFRGFSLKLIRRFTKQMLSSLNLLKQHRVIHCDLKPENILLRHPLHSEIKVIDFGSSCFENEKVYTYIQSRFYRSPEVILGMTYGMPIDMWSLGCILAELFTGVPIFPGENEQEQLACIMEVFGPPEKHLIEKSTRRKLFFDSMGKPRLTVSSKGRRRRPSSKTLQQALKCDDEAFLDFLTRCLRWDPERRLRPEEAIRHEFVTGHKMSGMNIGAPLPRLPGTAARDPSPVKRLASAAGPRPLPEPPGGLKGGSLTAGRDRTTIGVSPYKPVAGAGAASRRTSAASSTASFAGKRTSTGTGGMTVGSSNLPRAAGRSVSAKQDLASAGATVAMSRRV